MCFRAMRSRCHSPDHGPAEFTELSLQLGQSHRISSAFRRMHLLLQLLELCFDPTSLYSPETIVELLLHAAIAQRF